MLAFRVLVFVLLAFFSHSLAAQPLTIDNPQPASVLPVVVTNGWQISAFVLNNFGTLAFGGRGLYPFAADGLTLVRSNQFVRFVSAGDPVPGFSDKVFAGFLSFDLQNPPALLSLNDRDQVAFGAAMMTCDPVLGRGSQTEFQGFNQLWLNNREKFKGLYKIGAADLAFGTVCASSGTGKAYRQFREICGIGGFFIERRLCTKSAKATPSARYARGLPLLRGRAAREGRARAKRKRDSAQPQV